MEIPNACFDKPSPLDFLFENYFGGGDMPDTLVHNKTAVLNQGLNNDPSTHFACTVYSAIHAVNEENFIESEEMDIPYVSTDPVPLWKEALNLGAVVDYGWSLQGSCKLMKAKEHISGYTRCSNVDSVKNALIRKQLVQTGSDKIHWGNTSQNSFIAQRGASGGHAFIIEGYDDIKGWLICRNSFGEFYGIKGRFYVLYEDFDLLYSCYAYIDKDNTTMILYEKARKDWIWNGQKPNEIVTRSEAALMIFRIAGGLVKMENIWNGLNGQNPATRMEISIMAYRAKLAPEDKTAKGTMTRGELILKYYKGKKD